MQHYFLNYKKSIIYQYLKQTEQSYQVFIHTIHLKRFSAITALHPVYFWVQEDELLPGPIAGLHLYLLLYHL